MKPDEVQMNVYAFFKSVKISSHGLKTFRYFTEIQSIHGKGKPIGLVVMLNPGSAKPSLDDIAEKLVEQEYETPDLVQVSPDNTMGKLKNLIQKLYENNLKSLPKKFTIHIENLFNIKEQDSDAAKRLAVDIKGYDNLMFKERQLENKYNFVFFAWGNSNLNIARQDSLKNKYSDKAIMVHKLKQKDRILEVNYPVHPLFMNSGYFLDASKNKIFENGI